MDTMLAHPVFVEWRTAAFNESWRIPDYSMGHTLIESYV
jgi:glutathione S-transferase